MRNARAGERAQPDPIIRFPDWPKALQESRMDSEEAAAPSNCAVAPKPVPLAIPLATA